MADTRDIEASRPEFEAQMRAAGYRDDRHDTGEYVGVTSYRWEGWIAALAARPAEVDNEGLPPLPAPAQLDGSQGEEGSTECRLAT